MTTTATNNSFRSNKIVSRDLSRTRHRLGFLYGAVAGLSFAISNWGADGFLLSQTHTLHPWLKLILALLLCVPIGGLTGFIASVLDKSLFSFFLWLLAGVFFAWFSVSNTFQLYPSLLGVFNPEVKPLLHYSVGDILETNGLMVYMWMSIFWGLVGLFQIPLLEQTIFSLSFFSKIVPYILCMVLVIIGGLFIDNLNNEPLRSPILALDDVIQFAIDTQGQEIDKETSREMRVASLRTIQELLVRPRYYFIGSFDSYLGQVNIIINFGGDFAECTVVYNQTSFCKPLSP